MYHAAYRLQVLTLPLTSSMRTSASKQLSDVSIGILGAGLAPRCQALSSVDRMLPASISMLSFHGDHSGNHATGNQRQHNRSLQNCLDLTATFCVKTACEVRTCREPATLLMCARYENIVVLIATIKKKPSGSG